MSALLLAGAQPDVNVLSSSSESSALYTATVCGHEAVARRLVVAGADVNFQYTLDDETTLSFLHEATHRGQEQLVTDLLIGGANPNWRDGEDGACPPHVASEKGFDGIVSTLLLRRADKDALDHKRETPLMCASSAGRLPVVKTLLTAGADVDARDTDHLSALDMLTLLKPS